MDTTVEELVSQLTISSGSLDEEVKEKHIDEIAACDFSAWGQLSESLNLELPEDSDVTAPGAILRKWKEQQVCNATYRTLANSFLKLNRADLARKVCQFLDKKGGQYYS